MYRVAEPGPGHDRRWQGFVLLEAVIAMALLSAVVLALLSTTGGQLRTAADLTEMMTAQALAEDRMTTFRLLEYEGLRSPPDSLMAGSFPPPLDEWSWEAVVQEEDYDLFHVQVSVSGRGALFPMESWVHRARPEIGGSNGRGGSP